MQRPTLTWYYTKARLTTTLTITLTLTLARLVVAWYWKCVISRNVKANVYPFFFWIAFTLFSFGLLALLHLPGSGVEVHVHCSIKS